jgi:hypothetical protein
MNQNKQENTQKMLVQNWQLLMKSLHSLKLSAQKAKSIGQKEDYTFGEMETFDSLTSKFSRTSDIFLQKIIRSVWILLHEDTMPLIDVLNKAEKLNIILSAGQLLEIRDMRNQIAHEYIPEAIQELVPDILDATNDLEQNIVQCKEFLTKRAWIENS